MTHGSSGDHTLAIISTFNEIFNSHDVDALMDLFTDDCVFENTAPFPDGTRYEGQPAVRAFWETFLPNHPMPTSTPRTSSRPATAAPFAGATAGGTATFAAS